MKKLALFISFLILLGCTKEYQDNNVVVLGHGGMGINSFYPWNSYESIFKSLNLDSDGTEMDVRMTKDSVFVLYHSEALESETDLVGNIRDLTWEEIKNAKYGYPYLVNYNVAKLENVFKVMEGRSDKILDLEIKPYLGTEHEKHFRTFNANLLKLIDKYDVADHLIIEFNQEMHLRLFKESNTTISVVVFNTYEKAMAWADLYSCDGIVLSLDKLDKTKIAEIHAAGIKVISFNVRSYSENRKALDLGIDIIQTDNLEYLISLVD
jgi:glycerophosphoryl diester phosphodiesterase